ncbi:hypothetical protein ACFDTO_16085 [Microbacteriaceae bacterium 4G12]
MRKFAILLVVILSGSILSGCLYPKDSLKANQVPYKDQLRAVQTAVDEYKKENGGLLPIKTRDMNTPIYQKYPIDFSKLSSSFLQEPPKNAFESGGIYQYVLVDVETNPTVKLIDIRIAEQIRDLKLKLQMYRDQHQYPPFHKVLADGVYTLDYKKMGLKDDPYVVSPYSGKNLPFVIDAQGEIYVDYSADLYEILQKHPEEAKPGEDIRKLLVKDAPFVPAYSLAYTVKDKEPIFLVQ